MQQSAIRQTCQSVMQRLVRQGGVGLFALGNVVNDGVDQPALAALAQLRWTSTSRLVPEARVWICSKV